MRTLKDVPFIDISRENLMAANDLLDREQKGELLEMIIDTVLNGECQNSDSRVVNGVFNQFMAVINRKAAGFITRLNTLDEINAGKKQEKEQPKEEPVVEGPEFNQDFGNQIDLTVTKEDLEDEPYPLENWLNDIRNGLSDGGYQSVFDNGWKDYFHRREEALSFVYQRVPGIGRKNTKLA